MTSQPTPGLRHRPGHGKGVVSSFLPQVAEKGYQLFDGATANLVVDRAGDRSRRPDVIISARGGLNFGTE
jgi:hypothetical protein